MSPIQNLIHDLPAYLDCEEQNVFNRKSVLWEELLGRRDDLSAAGVEQRLQDFLAPGSTQASGTSAWSMDGTDTVLAYIEEKIDRDLYQRFSMPSTGGPTTFSFLDRQASMPFLWRFLTFQRSRNALRFLPEGEAFNVLEVGAGYGCVADLWIQSGRAKSYTIIDLPENLINSAFYLSTNHPTWTINLVDSDLVEPQPHSINLLTPGHIRNVSFDCFDLALNSDSLGEMPKKTAQAYVDWIHGHLRDGAVFFSKNGHRRGYDNFGVAQVSEYGYEKFGVREFAPNDYCTSAFDDFSHIAVLQKGGARPDTDRVRTMDTLANLYATGLSADIAPVAERFVAEALTDDDRDFLGWAERFFRGVRTAPVAGHLSYLCSYLTALGKGASSTENLNEIDVYLETGRSDNAIIYCDMFIRFFAGRADREVLRIPAVRHYSPEFDGFDRDSWLVRKLKYRLRFDVIRKKINPYSPVTRSTLMLAKNLALNLKQKRRLSIYR